MHHNHRFLALAFSAMLLTACATSHDSTRTQVQPDGQASAFPVAVSNPAAPYPASLRSKCVGGKVDFKASISTDGKVADVLILKSPNDELSRAVTDTVKSRWQFKPYAASPDGELAAFTSFMNFDPECH